MLSVLKKTSDVVCQDCSSLTELGKKQETMGSYLYFGWRGRGIVDKTDLGYLNQVLGVKHKIDTQESNSGGGLEK